MDRYLYHRMLPKNHPLYVAEEEMLSKGISSDTKSNKYYMNIFNIVKSDLVNKSKPSFVPKWFDINNIIFAELIQRSEKSVCFPLFTDKILVFDREIAELIYDQDFYESNHEVFSEAENFDTGLTIEQLGLKLKYQVL